MKRIFRCFDLAALCASGRHHSVLWSRYRGRDSLHELEHEHNVRDSPTLLWAGSSQVASSLTWRFATILLALLGSSCASSSSVSPGQQSW